MQPINEMTIEFWSKSSNESFARVVAAAFATQLDPTIEELADVKTAVSEAVTNAIIHGYESREGKVRMECKLYDHAMEIVVSDSGTGIEDVDRARQPMYTSKPDMERSGLGFTVMESFMDKVEVESKPGRGTVVRMTKTFKSASKEFTSE